MAEVFGRATLGPEDYDVDLWTNIYQVKSSVTGALIFDIDIANTTPMLNDELEGVNIEVQIRLVNRDGNLLHYILGPTILTPKGTSWTTSQKIVMMPGDQLQLKATAKGLCTYVAMISSLKIL